MKVLNVLRIMAAIPLIALYGITMAILFAISLVPCGLFAVVFVYAFKFTVVPWVGWVLASPFCLGAVVMACGVMGEVWRGDPLLTIEITTEEA